MATTITHCLALTTLVIAGTLIILSDHKVSAQCGIQIADLISKCSKFVQIGGPQIPPSADCCAVVKKIDVPCACNLVIPPVEKLVSLDKAVYVGRSCGLTIQPGLKCGSYTVPPLAWKWN